ncbi:MAG: Stk1 family PASTA domain-containing Ser/Thr kinase [Aeromicrobium sp.]|uniref:Stk1 family PASTA domain-containing Ser/Thr kinase n=1 Tax=Aeromicrobium sp. TaxID=1871063 RepID=UPI0039E5DE9F
MAVIGDDALIGQLIQGRYRITEFIARGGMASVFLAVDTRLDRDVAIKIMHQGLGDPAQFVERFRREAKSAARLNHRNVVAVFDQGSDGPITYLVMEHVPNRTLREVMRDEAPMDPLRTLDIVEQVLIALVAAHDAGIVHRDVKPENVLITPDGEVKVADFGLARAISSATTATGNALIGTVSYLAPEVVMHEGTDERSDVYAVGAMTYEMLTGLKPHHADTPIQVAYKHVHEDIGPPSALRPGLPDYVDALVARATARDRDQRAADARELLHHVRRVQQALGSGAMQDAVLAADLHPRLVAAPATSETASAAPAAAGADTEDLAPAATALERLGADHPLVSTSTVVLDPVGPAPAPPSRPPAPAPAAPAPSAPKPSADRSHSRRGRVLLILAILAAVLVGIAGYYFGVGRFDETPKLVDLTEQEAEASAKKAGFAFEVSEREFSEEIPAGTVISTDPSPGDRILPGSKINAVVSKGPERYTVPELAGMALADAEAALEENSLKLGEVTETWHQEVPEGQVVSIEGVAVGDQVKRDTEVDVVVSKGREPLPVTDYTGQTGAAATAGLEATGFVVAAQEEFSDDVPAGTVIDQNPKSGEALRGDTVTLTVSKGPELIEVPDVEGMKKDEAEAALTAAGFTPSAYGPPRNFRVRDQTPEAGSMQPPGTTITFFGF